MLRKIIGAYALLSVILLGGCAATASVKPMVTSYRPKAEPANKSLIHSINVTRVIGGRQTNPLWVSQIDNENFKKALEQSLQQAHLYQEYKLSHYILEAQLLKLKQPSIGLNYKVSCTINYTLKNKDTNKIYYNKTITSDYTATLKDAVLATIRMKIANEGAARANIKKLIDELYHLKK